MKASVLIHGQCLREDQVDSCKHLRVIPSLVPVHTFYRGRLARRTHGRTGNVPEHSPTGGARARGMIFTTHYDAPVAPPDSMQLLDATVTCRGRIGKVIGEKQK